MRFHDEKPATDSTASLTAENKASEIPQPLPGQAGPKDKRQSKAHWRKFIWLPKITQLALEGQSNRAIAFETRLPRRCVDRWLQEQRRVWAAKASETTAEVFAVALARLESTYREAMHACA